MTEKQALTESIKTAEMALAGLRVQLRALSVCVEDRCKNEAEWSLLAPCHADRGATNVCGPHIALYAHQGNNCTFTEVRRIR